MLAEGFQVRALCRLAEKGQRLFGDRVEIAIADTRQPETLAAAMHNISHIICCTGTTAFPSARWDFEPNPSVSSIQRWLEWAKLWLRPGQIATKARNSPARVDAEGTQNLVAAAPRTLERLIFISSCGVLRKEQFPFSLLNAFGVLDAKLQGEAAVVGSGLPFTIVRPGRLIDGPFTSYDLNTLLQAKTQSKLDVVLGTGDRLTGQTSRIDVAAACVACLSHPATLGQTFELINQGPRPSQIDWNALFATLPN